MRRLCKLKQEKALYDAAVKIQSVVRGYLARQRFLATRNAALMVQRKWRSIQTGREVRRGYTNMKSAALTIQKNWRMHSCLKEYHLAKQRVILLQSVWRQRLALNAAQRLRQMKHEHDSAVLMQAQVRGYIARRRYLRQRQAAVSIQRSWRAKVAAIQTKREYLALRTATIVIQRQWRKMEAKKVHHFTKDLQNTSEPESLRVVHWP